MSSDPVSKHVQRWKLIGKNAVPSVLVLASCLVFSTTTGGEPPASTVGAAGAAAGAKQARILVGPNILASRDGDFAHVELTVAASPHNASELLAGSIVFAHPDGSVGTRPYVSHDGGFRWEETSQPDQSELSGADPQVAYGISGTAYFMSLVMPDTRQPPELRLYRSTDGGRTWGPPTMLGNPLYDHPQIAVDQSYGRFAGRVYVSVLGGGTYPEYRIGVFRSDDDGRTFIGPVTAASGGGKIGIGNSNLMVLSDGTLVMPYCDFSFDPKKTHGTEQSNCWSVISNDGGLSFSAPSLVGTRTTSRDAPRLGTFPQFVTDSTGSEYKDRLYAVWDDFRNGRSKVAFLYSTDRGATWSAPLPIDSAAPETAIQFQHAIAVNKDGVVGVIWCDTRSLSDDAYNVYFAASVDGGKSFLPSVKLTDEISHRKGAGNMRISPATWKPLATLRPEKDTSARMTLLSPMSRWAGGGDYIGLAADIEGTFHPLWPDSRSGTFQMYTAQARVERTPLAAADKPAPTPCSMARTELTDDVTLVNDPSKFALEKRQADLPIRLKNNSKQPIYAPILVQVDGFGSLMGEAWKEYAPTILNASNKEQGSGAVFDYSTLLGSFDFLEPGGETGAFVWKLQLSPNDVIPDLHYRVFGNRPTSNCSGEAKTGTE